MAGAFNARFFDGRSAASRPAQVTLGAQGLLIAIEGSRLAEFWLYRELSAAEALPGKAGTRVTAGSAPDAQLIVEAPEFRGELMQLLPRYAGIRRWRRHGGEIALVIAIVAFVLAAFFAIPYLARPLAQAMPAAWDDKLGQAVERQVIQGRRICEAEAGTAALQTMLRALPYAKRYDGPVSIRVIDHPMANAFAAPGGRIVILRGLLAKAQAPEEVAGVLAHELGHVVEHHPTANAIRVLGVKALLDLIMGDSATVLETVGETGGLLLLFAQNRRDEAAADEVALELLGEAGIDSAGLADFFARQDKPRGAGEDSVFSYFSTHPLTDARQRRARESAGQGHRPALDVEAWRALRAICGRPGKD